MKKIILLPIILGSVLLVAGGALFAVALYKSKDNRLEHQDYKDLEAFNKFDIDLTIADFELKASTDGKATVSVDETKYDKHTVEVKDSALVIKGQDTRKWHERLFTFNFFQKVKVTVFVPEGNYEEFKLESDTGDVTVPGNYTFSNIGVAVHTGNVKNSAKVTDNLKIHSSTGNISVSDVTAKNVDLKASTGNVSLKNSAIEEKVELNTSTGNITVENVTCNDYASKSSTGSLKLDHTVVANHIEAKTSTGSVRFIASDANTINVKTNTGSVNLNLLTGKTFDCQSDTSKPKYPSSTIGAGLCKVETDTGSINITVDE